MPIGSDARFQLNTDPSLVPAQPAVSTIVNPSAAAPGGVPNNYNDWDFSILNGLNDSPAPGPAPAAQSGGGLNPLSGVMSFLASLFGRGQTPGPAQGMRGLLQRPVGRYAPGTDNLGNPMRRF